MPVFLYITHTHTRTALMVPTSRLCHRSVAAKVSLCSVCGRTGSRGSRQSCHRPQSCTSSMSQEIGWSPRVHFGTIAHSLSLLLLFWSVICVQLAFFPSFVFPDCQTCPSPWYRFASRPCGCRWTSRSLSLLFRPTWTRRRARRCWPACCCLSSPATTTAVISQQLVHRVGFVCLNRLEADAGACLIPPCLLSRCFFFFLMNESRALLEKAHCVPLPPPILTYRRSLRDQIRPLRLSLVMFCRNAVDWAAKEA